MRYGFVLPRGDARDAADMARLAEQAGWDGFFVWEPVWGIDAWVALAAAAMQTTRIKIGTMLTPPSRMRPWKLASETVTLDHLSGGRLILVVGLGAPDSGFAAFGEVTDRKTRAELMDESLEIITALWKGQPFEHTGKHYTVKMLDRFPTGTPPSPVQQPRIPIWVTGAWPRPKSMNRVVRYDGLLPAVMREDGTLGSATPDEIREMRAFVTSYRVETTPFDIVIEGETPGDDPERAAATVRPWIEAGATWWIEGMWGAVDAADCLDQTRRRLEQGPPRIEATAAVNTG